MSLITSDFSTALNQMTSISKADIPLFAGCCVAYLGYRLFMVNYVLTALGKILKVKRLYKFTHRTFDLIHYITSSVVGVLALGRRPYAKCFAWAMDCRDFLWQNPAGFEVTLFEKIYYMLVFVYYTVDIGFMQTSSEPLMILVHHIVTISEITCCVILQSPVVGLSIMLLHDITDLPLYLGKFFVYLGSRAKDITLAIFAISCTWFRIVNYPIIVYHVYFVGKGTTIHPWLYWTEYTLLVVLYLLHVIWEAKIFENLIQVLRGGAIHDNRSD